MKLCLEVFTAEMMQVVHRQRNLRTIVAGVPMITRNANIRLGHYFKCQCVLKMLMCVLNIKERFQDIGD